MNNNNLTKFAKYGVTGVAIVALILAGFVVNKAFELMTNHLSESIKTQQELTGAVTTLNTSVNNLLERLTSNKLEDDFK